MFNDFIFFKKWFYTFFSCKSMLVDLFYTVKIVFSWSFFSICRSVKLYDNCSFNFFLAHFFFFSFNIYFDEHFFEMSLQLSIFLIIFIYFLEPLNGTQFFPNLCRSGKNSHWSRRRKWQKLTKKWQISTISMCFVNFLSLWVW